jgi:hypothetical protein
MAATAVVAACLVAVLAIREHERRVLLTRLFGCSEAYDELRHCEDFSLYEITATGDANADDWELPRTEARHYIRKLDFESTQKVRALFLAPANFDEHVIKDFVFRPSIMLESNGTKEPFRVFLDFQSNEAVLLVDDDQIWFVAIDKVSTPLQKLLTQPHDNGADLRR